ncbi:MAG: hypothetical protein JJV92_10695 [Desulfosarcina sp.]|nr:hypothetical protein [Desulfobacterales bacterium]
MRKAKIILLLSSLIFALAMGFSDLGGFKSICGTASCVKVHTSSFARLFGLPLGFFGAAGLFVALSLEYFKKQETAALILYALCGFEAYFTFIEAVYIQSWCILCVVFLCFLFAATILVGIKTVKAPVAAMLTFFAAHFIFFYPDVTFSPAIMYDNSQKNMEIEIFASPSCNHCHEAIKDLRNICLVMETDLLIRPVCISRSDTEKSVTWICSNLFKSKTGTSRRLAEKIIWENEQEVKNICGNIAVPLICIKYGNKKQIYRGWNDNIQKSIYSAIAGNSINSTDTDTGDLCTVKNCG